ncbi:serine beta-lactamase mitochondrial, putative [Babesia ovata]|uniref:Serine beta-lactamase mitochondrial, putative n=1 Tax=Babesia ovata TaxID=189622 RepID=A0A2H6KEP7_9APIC|nr:serine beta-lactamase mitochondrial, putative [Babesia ovata]GBE61472.1 serine beta-lactamase mitochondrial, putative [Babesia ovata]
MKSTAVCKYDKIAHEIFAATLRAPSTSPRDQEPDSRRLRYSDLVAKLANHISDEKTLKLNLLLLPLLTKVPEVEQDFLKAAIPFLTCAARPYNSKYALDNGTAILNKWATSGLGNEDTTSQDVTEMLISPQAFKNTLLKLLNGKSDDNRVVNMRNQLTGVSWSPCMEEKDAVVAAVDDDDAECTFQPKLNRYPAYLRNAPKLMQPKDKVSRKTNPTLDLSPCGYYEDGYDQQTRQIVRTNDGEIDYGSPCNNVCPFGTRRFNFDMASQTRRPVEHMNAPASQVVDSPRGILLQSFAKQPHQNAAEKRVTISDAKLTPNYDVDNIDDKIEEIINSLPSITRMSPPATNDMEERYSLRFVPSQRHHLCSVNADSYERENYMTTPWQEKLRGGYVNTGMRFSQSDNCHSPSSPFSARNAGSLKQCDYILPRSFGIPIFKNSPAAGSHNEVYTPQKPKFEQQRNPLDVIEAQLAQLPVNLRQIVR